MTCQVRSRRGALSYYHFAAPSVPDTSSSCQVPAGVSEGMVFLFFAPSVFLSKLFHRFQKNNEFYFLMYLMYSL
jgi:hypothetical protein